MYVQKFIETYTEWNEFPDVSDLNEFVQENWLQVSSFTKLPEIDQCEGH